MRIIIHIMKILKIHVCVLTVSIVAIIMLGGCASSNVAAIHNPLLIEGPGFSTVWQNAVDTIEERFPIERRTKTEGLIESKFKLAYPPLWAPWSSDALTLGYFFEETLHEVRRKVIARVRKLDEKTTEIRVSIRRERRNYEQPPASFSEQYSLYDPTVSKRVDRIRPEYINEWTSMGSDTAMEQHLLRKILKRLNAQ